MLMSETLELCGMFFLPATQLLLVVMHPVIINSVWCLQGGKVHGCAVSFPYLEVTNYRGLIVTLNYNDTVFMVGFNDIRC
jgi:hypothetical protein